MKDTTSRLPFPSQPPPNIYQKTQIDKHLKLIKCLFKENSIDNYSTYIIFRIMFLKSNLPLDKLEEIMPEDLKAKRYLLGEKYNYT